LIGGGGSIVTRCRLDAAAVTAYVLKCAASILPAFPTEPAALLPDRFRQWFAARGWSPREHQLALLAKARDDRSALLIAPTGAGKTLAGFLPTLVELSSPSSAGPVSTGKGLQRSAASTPFTSRR